MKPLPMISIGNQPDHGFDEPLGLLSDCHRRIERFLAAMISVSRQLRGGHLDEVSRNVMEQSARYFATSGPRHTADEEASLFPRLRAASDPSAAEALELLDTLESDHREAEQRHALVDKLTRKWIDNGVLSAEESNDLVTNLEQLSASYARHIGIEDEELFPAAQRVLSSGEVEAIGREMADRRGVPFHPPAELSRK